jgi:hypothetical protein
MCWNVCVPFTFGVPPAVSKLPGHSEGACSVMQYMGTNAVADVQYLSIPEEMMFTADTEVRALNNMRSIRARLITRILFPVNSSFLNLVSR